VKKSKFNNCNCKKSNNHEHIIETDSCGHLSCLICRMSFKNKKEKLMGLDL